jgi:hypothetical protein
MNTNLWHSLEILSTQAALPMEWKQELGDDFAAARVLLRPTQHQVGSYPCSHPISCGCRHRVMFDSPEDVSAVCDCEEAACEPISLRPSDLIVYALDIGMLAAALRGAFHLNELESVGFEEVRSRLVGGWGLRRSRVFFNVPVSEKGLLKEIDRLCATVPDPFVLLMPTSRFCTPMVERALRLQGCAHLALAGIVTPTAPGILEIVPAAKIAVDTVLGDFGKRVAQGRPLDRAIARVEEKLDTIANSRREDHIDEEDQPAEVARQVLALAKKLDTATRLQRPGILTVFRLYCINEMSATQIAKRCGCSKTAIMKRLKILARKIGMPPGRLRKYSAQFERMEEEMSDGRAKRIYRQGLADGGADDHGEVD